MSSGFVSGGTSENPTERDDEWLKAQQELEANRRRKEDAGRQEGGKTLYEVLQNNKAAKQEQFEESIKLKNQFRNLDEDEIEFLDSVLESTRSKEQEVKRETTEQLDLFRRQQEEADRAILESGTEVDDTTAEGKAEVGEGQWAVNARKRKRVKEKENLKGIKIRKSSTNEASPGLIQKKSEFEAEKATASPSVRSLDKGSPEHAASSPPVPVIVDTTKPTLNQGRAAESPKISSGTSLGLAGYSSDED